MKAAPGLFYLRLANMQVTTLNSSAERSGLTLTLDPVENFVFSGLQQKFAEKFGCPTVWSTSTDSIQQVAKAQGGRNQVSYPYILLALEAYTVSSARGNTFLLTLMYRLNSGPIVSVRYLLLLTDGCSLGF